jgi:anti-sigma regulatory factor (Ser/Thr protein kinase)
MEAIALVVPARREYLGVVNLVLGGIGSRLDLPYEQVDDLQLAVDSVLVHDERARAGEITVEIEVDDPVLLLRIGPLERGSPDDPALRRVLGQLVSGVGSVERDGAGWLELRAERRSAGARAG